MQPSCTKSVPVMGVWGDVPRKILNSMTSEIISGAVVNFDGCCHVNSQDS